jgi:hypothetical protein
VGLFMLNTSLDATDSWLFLSLSYCKDIQQKVLSLSFEK